MILSRIAKALKDQNWLAVGIEFVIVILGVVIGFQVTVWNAGRVAEAREVAILDRLRDELAVDQAERQQSRNNASRLALLRETVGIVFSDAEVELTARQCNAIQTASYYSDASASSALPALQELLNDAQGLNLISDETLRLAIAEYVHFREGVPRLVDWHVRGSVNLPTAFPELLPQTARIDEEDGNIYPTSECDLAAMRSNRAFLNAFSENAWRYELYFRYVVQAHDTRVDALIGEISHVLGDTPEADAAEEAAE